MTKMESVEGKNKSTAYLQGCSVQGAIRFNSMTILLWFLTLKLGSTFIILSFTWRVPIPFNSKAKTHSRLRVKYYLDRAHWLGILDYYWLEWKLYSPFYLFYFIFFSRGGMTKLRKVIWMSERDNTCLPFLLLLCVRWLGVWKMAEIKRPLFSFQITPALPIPSGLCSFPACPCLKPK